MAVDPGSDCTIKCGSPFSDFNKPEMSDINLCDNQLAPHIAS